MDLITNHQRPDFITEKKSDYKVVRTEKTDDELTHGWPSGLINIFNIFMMFDSGHEF
ncbi:MAG: hypothetical protein ACLU3F_00425 [Blautia wexlerae]